MRFGADAGAFPRHCKTVTIPMKRYSRFMARMREAGVIFTSFPRKIIRLQTASPGLYLYMVNKLSPTATHTAQSKQKQHNLKGGCIDGILEFLYTIRRYFSKHREDAIALAALLRPVLGNYAFQFDICLRTSIRFLLCAFFYSYSLRRKKHVFFRFSGEARCWLFAASSLGSAPTSQIPLYKSPAG